jgi:hypothetical protein
MTTKTTSTASEAQAFATYAREANARLRNAGRKTSNAYLDGVEAYVNELTRAQRALGEQTQVKPVATVLGAHADLTDELVRVSVSAARDVIAA